MDRIVSAREALLAIAFALFLSGRLPAQEVKPPTTVANHSDGSVLGCMALSRDGKTLALGGGIGTVELCDLATGKVTPMDGTHFADNQNGVAIVNSVAFSHDGKRVASGSWNSTVKVWDTATGKCTFTLRGHSNQVSGVAFSPDGKILASASWDGTIKLWEFPGGKKVASTTLEGHSDIIRALAFSPDGKTLATSSKDGTFKIWDVATEKNTATLKGSSVHVSSICFSPDGKTLAAGNYYTLMLVDVASGKSTDLKGHGGRITAVFFYNDGKSVASSSEGYFKRPSWGPPELRLWDIASGKNTEPLGSSVLIAVSANGKVLAAQDGHRIRLIDLPTVKKDAK
jgi:WD40 repeat protein